METLRRCCPGPFITHSPKVMEVKAGNKQAYTRHGVCCYRDLLCHCKSSLHPDKEQFRGLKSSRCCSTLTWNRETFLEPGLAGQLTNEHQIDALLGANQRNDIKPPPSIRAGCVVSWVAGRARKLLAPTPGGLDRF